MREPITVVAGVLKDELGLIPGQVLLVNQEFPIPPDDRLYIALRLLGAKTFAARSEFVDGVEMQYVNRQEMYSITAYSSSSEARTRNWEIPAALKSIRCQQAQEANSMKIADIPAVMFDISEQDGTQRLNKFTGTVNALVAYSKQKPVEYYDQFTQPKIYTNP
jgi:hypothetical protein